MGHGALDPVIDFLPFRRDPGRLPAGHDNDGGDQNLAATAPGQIPYRGNDSPLFVNSMPEREPQGNA
jgi:hypothetical protein